MYWVLIVGYTEQHSAKILSAKAAKRIAALHDAEAGGGGFDQPNGGAATGSKPRTRPEAWFRPLWDMVGSGARWPISMSHLDSIRRKVVSQTNSVLMWLKLSEQEGLWKRMKAKYQPRQALHGYICARLSNQIRPASTCASYDKAQELISANGDGMVKPCWQLHPGLCRTLDAAILRVCCAFGNLLVRYVRRIGSGSQRYLMFIRQCGAKRSHVLLYMPGSTLITSGPLVMFWAQEIDEMKAGGGRGVAPVRLRRAHAGAEWVGNACIYDQQLASARAAAAGFQCGTSVKCHHLSQPGPRLKLPSPVSFTQFGLAKILHTAAAPATSWAVYEATEVQKIPERPDCTVLITSWNRIDMGEGTPPTAAAQNAKASVASALQSLPDDALLSKDLLYSFSRLRHGKKSTLDSEHVQKTPSSSRRVFKRTQTGQKSEESSTSDGVTEATSDSDDGAGTDAVQKAQGQRKPRKRQAATQGAGAAGNGPGAKRQKANVVPGPLAGDPGADVGVGVGAGSSASGGASSSGGNGGSGGAASSSGAALPPPPPVRNRGGRPRNVVSHAPPGSRAVTFGGRMVHELWADGSHVGYSLMCKHHGLECVRDCGFGKRVNMSPSECRRRLLAWEAAGAALTTGPLAQRIADHSMLGSSRLLSAFAA